MTHCILKLKATLAESFKVRFVLSQRIWPLTSAFFPPYSKMSWRPYSPLLQRSRYHHLWATVPQLQIQGGHADGSGREFISRPRLCLFSCCSFDTQQTNQPVLLLKPTGAFLSVVCSRSSPTPPWGRCACVTKTSAPASSKPGPGNTERLSWSRPTETLLWTKCTRRLRRTSWQVEDSNSTRAASQWPLKLSWIWR